MGPASYDSPSVPLHRVYACLHIPTRIPVCVQLLLLLLVSAGPGMNPRLQPVCIAVVATCCEPFSDEERWPSSLVHTEG
jgi:hypothetical protein